MYMNSHVNFFKDLETNNTNYGKFIDNESGFARGSLQKNVYDKYRNYPVTMPKVRNEKERLMLMIQIYGFVCNDLSLYLDIYPNDQEALERYRLALASLEQTKKEFTDKYYSLDRGLKPQAQTWEWYKHWPWRGDLN